MEIKNLYDRVVYLLDGNDNYYRNLLLIEKIDNTIKLSFANFDIVSFIILDKDTVSYNCKTYCRNKIQELLKEINSNYDYELSTRGCKNDIFLDEVSKL